MDTFRSEELIKSFYGELVNQGMSPASARRHRDRLRFFLHAYVAEEWPRQLDRIEGEIVRDFLGSWFLRHVGGGKADILNFITTFRRFYESLYINGGISVSELDDISMVLESKDYFMSRYDEYFNPIPDAWEDFSAGRPGVHPALDGVLDAPIDRQLWMLARNLDVPETPAVIDFALFLDYMANVPVKLTKAQARIPHKHVRRINQRMSTPENIQARGGMDASRRISWFHHLARELELTEVNDKNQLVLTQRGEAFFDLPPEAQLTVILDGTWRRLPWCKMGPTNRAKVSDWAQEHQDGFAALLAQLTPGREWLLEPEPAYEHKDALLARYIMFHDVVENHILFALKETGVLDYSLCSDSSFPTMEVKSITISRFGRQMMKLYTRRALARDALKQDPLERLQECLLL